MWSLITQRHIKDKHGTYCDMLENNYVHYFEGMGVNLIVLPNVSGSIKDYLGLQPKLGGIILSGGNDIDPAAFNQKPFFESDYSSYRDKTERQILSFAIENKMPVLGICRGMQFINVFFGGTLIQNITRQIKTCNHNPGMSHSLKLVDKQTRKFLKTDFITTNSYHNQAVTVETMSPDLRIFILDSKTEIVEGLYHPNYPIAGIQCHPERNGNIGDHVDRLIMAFRDQNLFWG